MADTPLRNSLQANGRTVTGTCGTQPFATVNSR